LYGGAVTAWHGLGGN